MTCRRGLYLLVGLTVGGASAMAQPGATTVQLPTFHQFSVNTTVSVPTGGGMVLGGVSRSLQQSNRYGIPGWSHLPLVGGPLGVRQTRSASSTGFATVHATVIDLKELERQQHQAARPARTSWTGGRGFGTAGMARDPESIARRVAEIRRQQLQHADGSVRP